MVNIMPDNTRLTNEVPSDKYYLAQYARNGSYPDNWLLQFDGLKKAGFKYAVVNRRGDEFEGAHTLRGIWDTQLVMNSRISVVLAAPLHPNARRAIEAIMMIAEDKIVGCLGHYCDLQNFELIQRESPYEHGGEQHCPISDAKRALRCLYLAVDESIADDVKKRVYAAFQHLAYKAPGAMQREMRLCALIQNIHQHYNPGMGDFDIEEGLKYLPSEYSVNKENDNG